MRDWVTKWRKQGSDISAPGSLVWCMMYHLDHSSEIQRRTFPYTPHIFGTTHVKGDWKTQTLLQQNLFKIHEMQYFFLPLNNKEVEFPFLATIITKEMETGEKELPLISATGTSLQGLLTQRTQWHKCMHTSASPPVALTAVHLKHWTRERKDFPAEIPNLELYIIYSWDASNRYSSLKDIW